ncbi:WD repeat-containing protein on Y chromosome isoform X2 [Nematostella vectensis]|uniref:WD repeat-containing protein on Y chromosome isoform X2 n=1 Tax=Nematostella vectensis TaxID=45351 RepID=UPI0020773A00|nr:WD repeat-containing protein on Y chromosome isoform X2 [Nematostella vectensis]
MARTKQENIALIEAYYFFHLRVKMPPVRDQKKIRPSTASGVLQSHDISAILDDIRPVTAPDKNILGLDPTFITSRHHVPGTFNTSQFRGRQVHGGIPENDFKFTQARRATIGGFEEFEQHEKPKRPSTAVGASRQIKLEDRITLDHLNRMRQAFEEADTDGSGTLDLDEFKDVIQALFGFKFKNDDQMTALFMKIDSSSDGEINWDEFCTFMQLEYAEKEESYFRSKETSFQLPALTENSSQREQVIRVCHTSDNNFLVVSQDGLVSFWSQNLEFKRMKHIESSSKKTKWITDYVLMPHFNKFIISTGDREIQFFELSTFEPYCQISGLETTPLRVDYCSPSTDECIIIYGDSQGCVNIFIMHSTGETLRNWKKMPKVEGIASVNIDSVVNSENTKFIRWKVHNDWVAQLKYYDSLRAVISCSNHQETALVIGQTTGSTHIEAQLRENTTSQGERKKAVAAVVRDNQPRRRLDSDQTVFRVYKGVKTFDFCKEKNLIVTGGMDRLVRMWNPYVPSKPTGILRGHTAPIFHLFIVAEDDRIFSISTDKTVKVWDLHDQSCLLTVRPKAHKIRGDVSAIHYNPSSRGLAVATSDQVALLPLKTKPSARDMTTTHKEAVTCLKYNKSFKHVVTASEGSVCRVWDVETGHAVFEFNQLHGDTAITCMAFDSTERRLISGGRDGRLRIWNYNNGHCIRTLEKEKDIDEVTDLTYIVMHKNRYIISVGWDRRINVFSDDTDDFHHVQRPYIDWSDDLLNGHKEDILSVAVCPPNLLATSSYDGEIIIWNRVSGHIFCHIHSPLRHKGKDGDMLAALDGGNAIDKLVFLPKRASNKESATLVASGPQGYVHFWNVYNGGQLYAAFRASQYSVSCMATDSDNKRLVTTDSAGFLYVWDVEDYCLEGKVNHPPDRVHAWRCHIQSITGIELIEAYDVILTSSIDCTVRAWTWQGHFIGTFGQPKMWDITEPATYQHPMAPYDVLVDPQTLPEMPAKMATRPPTRQDGQQGTGNTDKEDQESTTIPERPVYKPQKNLLIVDDAEIADELKKKTVTTGMGKRLRHEKLRRRPREASGPSHYQTLKCFDLEDTPSLPPPPSSTIDDPLDFRF